MSPGWHPDPDGTDQLRWWDGERWTDDTQPAPAPPRSGRPTPTTPDGPTTDDGPQFTEPTFESRRPRRILWAVLALGVGMLALAVAVTFVSTNSGPKADSTSAADTDAGSDDTTPDTKAEPEVKPTDSVTSTTLASAGGGVFTESNHLWQITAGPDWHLAPSGLSATPLWTIGTNTAADASIVNIVTGTVPDGTTSQQFAQQTIAGISTVPGLTVTSKAIPTTLTDGTVAAMITNDYIVSGVTRRQELLVAVKGTTAVTTTVSSSPDQAAETFKAADPYIRSLQIF